MFIYVPLPGAVYYGIYPLVVTSESNFHIDEQANGFGLVG
tara:strand:- start:23 stop:142 length:120 start_codon:yes stop_codon:yes gene_type:complete